MKSLDLNLTVGRLTPTDFQIYYKARINKTIWYTTERIDIQINRTE